MKANLRRLLAIVLVLMMVSADICAIAEAVATLTLPSALQIIEEEAFAGNTSIKKVIVPDDTTEIRSRAFADSSMTELVLPDSLTFIAEDAFEGCGEFALTVPENCYAYDRCVELGLIKQIEPIDITKVSCTITESVYAGCTPMWAVRAQGGEGSVRYSFELIRDGETVAVQDYGAKNYYSHQLSEPGSYVLHVTCVDDAQQVCEAKSATLKVLAEPLEIVSVTASASTAVVNEEISWTAETLYGSSPVLYSFTVLRDGIAVASTDFGESAVYSYVPQQAGYYVAQVTCMDQDATVVQQQSAIVTVLSVTAAVPAAPTLLFADSSLAFTVDSSDAPVYGGQSITVSWQAVENAQFYCIALDEQVDGEWVNLLLEDELNACSIRLDASLFTKESALYRFNISSHGMRMGETALSYFAVEKVEVDDTILVADVASLIWEQAHCYAAERSFAVQSQLPWTAISNAEWVECTVGDDDMLTVSLSAQAKLAEREADITISNGVNTATIHIYQGTTQKPPQLLVPQLSADATQPTQLPVGELRVEWDDTGFGRTKLAVYEIQTDGALREICSSYLSSNYWYMTEVNLGEQLATGRQYMLELTGFYSSRYAANEHEQTALKQRWYFTMSGSGHSLLVNGGNAVTLSNITYDTVFVTASNYFTCDTDVDWLTAEIAAPSMQDSAVSITALINDTSSVRTGHVTFNCGTAQAVVTVRQESMLPQILKPQGLSQTASSPTTLYMDLNQLSDAYTFFLYKGDSFSIAREVSGTYEADTELDSATDAAVREVELSNEGLVGNAKYRLAVTSGEMTRYYYVKIVDDEEAYYEDIALGGWVMQRWITGTAAQSTTQTLKATTSWKATKDVSWLTVSKTSGTSGTHSITISAAANTTGAARRGMVTFASTSSDSEAWLVVEQSAQDYMEVYYNSDLLGYVPYESGEHCAMLEGAEGRTNQFLVYSSMDYKVVSNTSWITLSTSGASSSTKETGSKFRLYLEENTTGAVRSGTVTLTCGLVSRTLSVTQAPALGSMTLVAPSLSTSSSSPSVVQHDDMTVTWMAVDQAVRYSIDTSAYSGIEPVIYADGRAQYSFVIPKTWMKAYSSSNQKLYITAYDQYGHSVRYTFYFLAVTGDAALVNGESQAQWSQADDIACSESFVIQASENWTASASASWISLSTSSGESGDTLVVSLSENTGAARSGTVTVTVGTASTVISINQCAYLAAEYPQLTSPSLSSQKGSPTLVTSGDTLAFTWKDEPQAWHYDLTLSQFTGATVRKTIAKSGTLRNANGSYAFEGLELGEGELYSVMLRRYSARYGYTSAEYYLTLSSNNAWVLVEDLESYDTELDGGEDHDYLSITSGGYWNAVTHDDWILLGSSPIHQADLDEYGTTAARYASYGNVSGTSLCVSVLANPGSEPRTGTVTVTSGGASATILVKQYQTYQIARLTSPQLSTSSAEVGKFPYGAVTLRWSRAKGGTGRYEITVYESESQRTGYGKIYEKRGITSCSHTIAADQFTEGLYYRIRLDTELSEGDCSSESYYFQMGYKEELTASLSLSGEETAVGTHLGITVQARGGAGGYRYAYQLLQDGIVVEETAYETMSYYSFSPQQVGAYHVRVYVRDSSGTVIVLDSQEFRAEEMVDNISLSRSVWAAGAQAETFDVAVNASTTWTASPSADWITVSGSDAAADINVSANPDTDSRTASVTFTAGSASAMLSIVQEGCAAEEGGSITLSSGVWNLSAEGGAAATSLTVTCDDEWKVTGVPEWLTLSAESGTGTSTIQVYAAANPADARSAQMNFVCGAQSVSWLVTQTGSESSPRVTAVSVTDDTPETGVEVTFVISASNADTVIFTVDGKPYEEIHISGDTATFTRAFSSGGVREVTFVPVRGSVIGAPSDVLTLNVVSYGALGTPTLICESEAELGESVEITWNKIVNADAYVIYVRRDGILLEKESAWTQESYTLSYDVLSCEGTYVIHVMPVGTGYTQSEAAAILTVVRPETTTRLAAPRAGAAYDVGNVLGMQASNPEGRPLTMQLYKDGELLAVFPETGTISALEPYYEYTLTEAGTYQANLTVYGEAGNVLIETAKVSFSVSGPIIETGTYIGTGERGMYTDQATSFRIVTNTAVSTVTVSDGTNVYTVSGGGTLNTSNWTRVFTGTMNAPVAGKHVVTVTAQDDYDHTVQKTLTYYAVARDSRGTAVYPQKKQVLLRDAPDVTAASATLYPSDKATLLGVCGDYRYIDFGGAKGFVHMNDVGTARLTLWDGLSVAVPQLAGSSLTGCILLKEPFEISWTSSVALPASAMYRVSLVAENGTVTQKYLGADRSFSLPMNSLTAGRYTVRVEVISADQAVVYLTVNSAYPLDVKSTYNDLFAALDGERYGRDLNNLHDNHRLFSNLYLFFTSIGYYDRISGTMVKADLEKLTKNAVFKGYQAYFGDTLTAIGEKELVRASIAEAIMDDSASRRVTLKKLDVGSFKKFLEFFGVEETIISNICTAEVLDTYGFLDEYDPETSGYLYNKLTDKYKLDTAGIADGISTGIKIGELMASVWSKFIKYSNADSAEIAKIISQLKATGDADLVGVASYLEILNDEDKLLAYLIIGYGGKEVADHMIGIAKDTLEEGVAKLVSKLPGGFAFTIGAAIGKSIGLAINNGVFNVEDIQNTACELQWRIDAAGAYYNQYMDAYCAFSENPVKGYEEYVEATITFGQMISIIYQGWADFLKAYDDAGWNQFVRFWTRDSGISSQAQYQADTLPALALNNLGTSIDYFYYHFLLPQGVKHISISSSWIDDSEE